MRQSAIQQVIACFTIIGLLTSTACQNGEDAVASSEEALQAERSANTRHAQIWAPDEGDHLWVFAESKDNLGSGGEFHIYIDSETHPDASASFSRFALGVGGALPEHRHEKTEEIAYFVSGEDPTTLPPEEFAKIAAEHDMILNPSATEPDTMENR